jgi:hypothetical protein
LLYAEVTPELLNAGYKTISSTYLIQRIYFFIFAPCLQLSAQQIIPTEEGKIVTIFFIVIEPFHSSIVKTA